MSEFTPVTTFFLNDFSAEHLRVTVSESKTGTIHLVRTQNFQEILVFGKVLRTY